MTTLRIDVSEDLVWRLMEMKRTSGAANITQLIRWSLATYEALWAESQGSPYVDLNVGGETVRLWMKPKQDVVEHDKGQRP